jgi:glycosyltransferase involved in cell wall biosynthesis
MATLFLVVASFVLINAFYTLKMTEISKSIRNVVEESWKTARVPDAKTMEEVIASRAENELKTRFLYTFFASAAAAALSLVAAVGVLQYFQTRRRERLDRAGADLSELWKGLASPDPDTRAASIAGFQQFLTPDKSEHHARVAAGLAFFARLGNEPAAGDGRDRRGNEMPMRRAHLNKKPENADGVGGKRPDKAAALGTQGARDGDGRDAAASTLQGVLRAARESISPALLRGVSWQGATLCGADLSRREMDLRRPDFHGIDFSRARLEGCKFNGCDLSDAKFERAILTNAEFEDAILSGASFRHADLRNATLCKAKLNRADLRNAKLLGADLFGANLIDVKTWPDTNWADTRNWRHACFNPKKKAQLLEQYGSIEEAGPRVLMLLWEYPPFAVGGLWTSCYHLLQHLQHAGANVTLFVPWDKSVLDRSALGYEYDLVCLGIPRPPGEAYITDSGAYAYSSYRSLVSCVDDFSRRAVDHIKSHNLKFQVVHAHDWLTFKAAMDIAERYKERGERIPWVAHFHSTELDRREGREDTIIGAIESKAYQSAQAIVAVSEDLKKRLEDKYPKVGKTVKVIPDCLYKPPPYLEFPSFIDRVGSRKPARVIFVGRLSEQKGPIQFIEIADELLRLWHSEIALRAYCLWKERGSPMGSPEQDWLRAEQESQEPIRFDMYGRGDLDVKVAARINKLRPHSLSVPADTRFSAMEPADVDDVGDRSTGEWWGRGSLTGSEMRRVAKRLSDKILKGVALQLADPYTHLITVENPKDDLAKHYLVATSGLPAYHAIGNPFVVLRGSLEWKVRFRAFEMASAVVVPSRSEPFGLVVLEAMQSGVPVLYPDYSGVARVINEVADESKELKEMQFKKVDAKEIAGKILSLLLDREKWEGVVEAQIRIVGGYADQKMTKQRSIKPLRDLWNELITPKQN